MKNYLFVILASICSLFLVTLVSANPQPEQKLPLWWKVIPQKQGKLKAGDKIFMMTNLEGDPFNGLYVVDRNGTVLPRFCKDRVKISGLTEIEASRLVLKHTGEQRVYKLKSSIQVFVANAKRFPHLLKK